MIYSNEFIKKLTQFGLNSYEAKIWIALLSQGVSTAGELSDIANVPRSRSYDVLESLEKKGFIMQKIGKPIKYVSLPPEEVLDRVKKQITEQAQKQAEQMDELKGSEMLNQLNTLHTEGVELVEPADLSGSLRSRGSIYNQIVLAIKEAEEEILLMTTANEFTHILQYAHTELEHAHKRGVIIHVIIHGSLQEKPSFIQIHQTQEVHARFIVVDKKQLIFMLLPEDKIHTAYDVGIWINTPYFSQALADVFEMAFPKLKNV